MEDLQLYSSLDLVSQSGLISLSIKSQVKAEGCLDYQPYLKSQ